MNERITLTQGDKTTTGWTLVEKYAKQRLETLRGQLEAMLPIDETNRIRGQIKEIKLLLQLGQQDSPPT